MSSLSQIPRLSKILVSGFLREIEKLLDNSWMIADDVGVVCLLFARPEFDRFNRKYIHNDIYIKQGNIVIHNGHISKPRNVYLENIVWTGIHIWEFECLCIGSWYPHFNALIGIFNVAYKPVMMDKTFDNTERDEITGYGLSTNAKLSDPHDDEWHVHNWNYNRVCSQIRETDIITLRCDFDELKLTYFINDRQAKSGHNIKPGKYRAAISMMFPHCAFELISYQTIY